MSDLISRQEAINLLKETDDVGVCWKGGYIQRHSDFEEAINCIKELPSAEAIPVSWIKERIENAIEAKQTLIAQMWLELIDGYRREKNDHKE